MQKATTCTAVLAFAALVLGDTFSFVRAATPAAGAAALPPTAGAITSGWVLIKEGVAEGTIEPDAKHSANPDPHILRIAVTKYAAEPGTGRVGAKNTHAMPVKEGQDYDITFTGISEGIGVGLVVSLENDQGKVLARTTLPEIGRGRGGGGGGRGRRGAAGDAAAGSQAAASAPAQVTPAAWRPYLVNLHIRASDPAAHLVITPIEPVPVWLDNLAINERK